MPRTGCSLPSIGAKMICSRMCSQRTRPLGSSARTSMARWPLPVGCRPCGDRLAGSARGLRDGCGRRWPGAAPSSRRRPARAAAPARPRCGSGWCGSRCRPSPGRRPGCPSPASGGRPRARASACLRPVMSRAMPSTPTTRPSPSRSGSLRDQPPARAAVGHQAPAPRPPAAGRWPCTTRSFSMRRRAEHLVAHELGVGAAQHLFGAAAHAPPASPGWRTGSGPVQVLGEDHVVGGFGDGVGQQAGVGEQRGRCGVVATRHRGRGRRPLHAPPLRPGAGRVRRVKTT